MSNDEHESGGENTSNDSGVLVSFFGNARNQLIVAAILIGGSLLVHTAIEGSHTSVNDVGKTLHEDVPLWLDYIPELLRDFGIGFVVAAGIGLSVERAATTERSSILRKFKSEAGDMLQRVSENSMTSYFKKELPDGWFEYLKQQIDSHSCMRRNLDVEFQVRELSEEEQDGLSNIDETVLAKYLVFETTTRYVVENLTSSKADFPISTYTEFPYADELRGFTCVTGLKVDGCAVESSEVEKADDRWSDTDTHKQMAITREVPQNGKISIEISTRTLKLRSNDSVVWTSIHPTNGARFRAQAPKESALFFAILHSESSGNMIRVSDDGSPIVLAIEQPILPLTACEIRWADRSIVGNEFLSDAGGDC